MNIIFPEKNARKIIEESFPRQIRSKIPHLIYDAYALSYRISENTAMLNWARGKSLIPHLKNMAVEFSLIQAIKNEELPFNWRISYTANNSASLVEFYKDDILLHVNQVSRKSTIARPAYCRDQYLKPFDTYFDLWDEFDGKEIVENKPNYFQLNHGYQSLEPNFIELGIPGENKKWVESIHLLEEFAVLEGRYPKSKPEDIKEFNLEEFQQYAEEGEKNGYKGFNN